MSTEPLAPCDGSSLSARVATAFVKLTLRVFFRRTEVTGIENLTPEGGGLIVSWHPNALIDPALILTSIPRRIVFGARHGLFKWPVLGALMRALGTVPVYRKQDADGRGDDATRRARNDESLDALADAIVDGAYAVLFPEGDSHDQPAPTELRTGAARLYYRALARTAPGSAPPAIVPMGLHCDKKRLFGSNALVWFHPPLSSKLRSPAAGDSEDPVARSDRVRELTLELTATLHTVVHATESWTHHHALHRIRTLMRAERAHRAGASPGKPDMKERVLAFQRIREGYEQTRRTDPVLLRELLDRTLAYDALLTELGIRDHELDRAPALVTRGLALLLALQAILVYLVLPPIPRRRDRRQLSRRRCGVGGLEARRQGAQRRGVTEARKPAGAARPGRRRRSDRRQRLMRLAPRKWWVSTTGARIERCLSPEKRRLRDMASGLHTDDDAMTHESASFEGSIAPAVLPRVVRDLWRARATGVLDLRNRDIGRLLVFQKGNIVFAATNQKDERLGERLIRAGKIKRSDLELAFRVMERSNERIGRTVVDLGWLSPMEMRRFVATQIVDIIYSVFSWREGSYRFEPSDGDTSDELPLQIKTAEVIHEGARRISDLDAIRTGIGRLDRAIAFAGGKKLSIPVTLDDGHILSRVDGIRTIEEIVSSCPLSEEDALRRIYALLLAEVLIARTPDNRRAGENDDETADRLRQFRDSVKARYAALPLGDFYDRVGIDFGATEEEIREGFERVIAALEPEDGFRTQVADMEPMLTTLREGAREAYETLSVAETRARYDRKFAHAAPGSTHAGAFEKDDTEKTAVEEDEDEAERAEFEYLEAQRLFDSGDYFDAVASLGVAVRLDPENADYHCLLGLWLSQNPGCWDAARAHFEEAIELDSENIDALLGLAELHEHEDGGGDAHRLYERVLKLDPENEVAREKLATPATQLFGLKPIVAAE